MRVGENPTKFVRKNPQIASIPVTVPKKITVITITYIPHLTGYYEDGLDILQLNFTALKNTLQRPFDFIVFDNGSCREATDFLLDLKKKDIIQVLLLSSGNMKKLGAWNYLFTIALGDYIYYFDSDMYHYPGWFDALENTMESFPQAGIVGAFHNITDKNISRNIEIAENDRSILVEYGNFIPEEKLREVGESLGTDIEHFVNKRKNQKQYKISRKNAAAFLGASHCQFLTKKDVITDVFPRPFDWALHNTDKEFDRLVDEAGWLRLTTCESHVYHVGNTISEKMQAEMERMDLNSLASNKVTSDYPKAVQLFIKLRPIRYIIKKLYAFFFKLMYRIV